MKRRIGEILVEKGVLKIGDISQALKKQEHSDAPLGEILLKKGLISYQDILTVLEIQGWETIDVSNFKIPINLLERPKDLNIWRENLTLPLNHYDGTLHVVMYNPSNKKFLEELKDIFEVENIIIKVDLKPSIVKKVNRVLEGRIITPETHTNENESGNTETFYIEKDKFEDIYQEKIKKKIDRGYTITVQKDTTEGIYKINIKE